VGVEGDFIGSGAVIADGAGEDGGIVGGTGFGDDQHMLTNIKHSRIPPWISVLRSVKEE
jgi:hypothetical protein